MKKKNFKRLISILLCLVCFAFVGCDGGPDGDYDQGNYSSSLDGSKVLTRPADFDFAEIV